MKTTTLCAVFYVGFVCLAIGLAVLFRVAAYGL